MDEIFEEIEGDRAGAGAEEYGRPTDEEAAEGFAELWRLPIARWVVACGFAPPDYYCGGQEDSAAEEFVRGYLAESDPEKVRPRLAKAPGGRTVFDVEVRHEKRRDWRTVRVVVQVSVEIRAEDP